MLNRCHLLEFSAIGPIDYRLGRQVFILESRVRFPVGLLEQVQMYLDKESFNGPKDWGVPGRLLRYWIMV